MKNRFTNISLGAFIVFFIVLFTINLINNRKIIKTFNYKMDSLKTENNYLKIQNAALFEAATLSQKNQLLTFTPKVKKKLDSLCDGESNLLCIYIGEDYCNSCLLDLYSYVRKLQSDIKKKVLIIINFNTKQKLLVIKDIFGSSYNYLEVPLDNIYERNVKFERNKIKPFIFIFNKNIKSPICVNPFSTFLITYNFQYFNNIENYFR